MISIILPTYNEKENIGYMVSEINKYVPNVQIVIVDDNSPDGTGKIADVLAEKNNIRVVHRNKKKGLGPAIAAGFMAAEGNIIGVMDADRSHPPEFLPKLIEPIISGDADFVIGSRKIKGGGVNNWPLYRRIISWGAGIMAKPLTNVKDPISGMFFMKKEVIDGISCRTRGYKICLELLVKGKSNKTIDVPYKFLDRSVGKSKLDFFECINYIIDWSMLMNYKFRH